MRVVAKILASLGAFVLSLVCGFGTLLITYIDKPRGAFGAALYMPLFAFPVWLLVVVPSVLAIRAGSIFWRPLLCGACGAIVALLAMFVIFSGLAPGEYGVWARLFSAAAVVGASCFVFTGRFIKGRSLLNDGSAEHLPNPTPPVTAPTGPEPRRRSGSLRR